MINQRTIKKAVNITGFGVHSAKAVSMTIHPAPPNTGVVFRRLDLNPIPEIPAHIEYIDGVHLSTRLVKENVYVITVEHLLSAIAGLQIDNLYVDLTSDELPIMDGSAEPFVYLLQEGGIIEQNAPKRFVRIKEKVEVHDGDKIACVEPYEGFKICFSIEFKHPLFNDSNQIAIIDFSKQSYIEEIARARTFGFLSDYEMIRKSNLALGADLDNTVVLDDYRILNEGGLRYPDEFVKHKILDAVGDLYLLGYNLIGSFVGHKSGHTLNACLLKKLLSCPEAWEVVVADEAPLAQKLEARG